MAFDWVKFFNNNRIEYRTSGENVSRGNAVIRCPWCGEEDQSGHMGVHLSTGEWGCWRSTAHRGRSPVRLVEALLRCSRARALDIVGRKQAPSLGSDETLGGELSAMLGADDAEAEEVEPKKLKWPKEIKQVDRRKKSHRSFLKYLMTREYTFEEAIDLCNTYGLRCATSGPFSYRLVIPVRDERGLVGWNARALSDTARIRYKSLSDDPEKAEAERLPVALENIKNCLFNYRELVKAKDELLVVMEGGFDALRVDYFGREYGIRGTCLFSKTISRQQEELLANLSTRFKRKLLLLDPDAATDAFGVFQQVEAFGFTYHTLTGTKDPAKFGPGMVRKLLTFA